MKHCPRTLEEAAWYANGTLAADARMRFEDHLADCPECRSAVALDTRLAGTMAATAANVLPAPQTAWRRLETRLDSAEAVASKDAPSPDPTKAADPRVRSGAETAADVPPPRLGSGTHGEASPPRETGRPGEGLPREATVRPGRRRRRARLARLTIAAQAAAILLLAGLLWVFVQPPGVQSFRTLGDPDPALVSSEPLVRVVFPNGYSYTAASKAAAAAGAELQGRFDDTDIYTVTVPVLDGEDRADKVAEVIARLRRHPDVLMAEPITDPAAPGGQP